MHEVIIKIIPDSIEERGLVDRWVQDHQRDAWRKQAKSSGYRARSAFKLKQIQDRHKIIKVDDSVLDVGCHPGGWSQVAVELVGENGKVVGIDLQACVPVEGANLLVGDITEKSSQDRVLDSIDTEVIDVVILKYGGHFVTKLFQGSGVEELIALVKPHFQTIKRFSPMASRNSSSEVYLICKFHTPKRGPDWMIAPAFEKSLEHREGGLKPADDIEPAKSTFTVRRKSTSKE